MDDRLINWTNLSFREEGVTILGQYLIDINVRRDSPYPADSDFQDMVVRVDQIPEPASFAVLGAGLLALGLIRRRKAV